MKFKDVKDISLKDLKKKEEELREKLFEARMKNTLGQLSNPIEIRHTRRDIARLKTAHNQKRA